MPRLPKQIIWSVLLWLIVSFNAWTEKQTATITVTPNQPTDTDSITILISGLINPENSLPQGFSEHTTHTINNNIITIAHIIRMVPQITHGIDLSGFLTVNVDALPQGDYTIEYSGHIAVSNDIISAPQIVARNDFSVSSSIKSIPTLSDNGISLLIICIALICIFNLHQGDIFLKIFPSKRGH